jgi:hypothetical protein
MGSRWRNVAYVVEDTAILSQELEQTTSKRVRQMAMRAESLESMVGRPVSDYIAKHHLGPKMSGKERWTEKDKEFQLESGLAEQDRGYLHEPKRPAKRNSDNDPSRFKHVHRFELL